MRRPVNDGAGGARRRGKEQLRGRRPGGLLEEGVRRRVVRAQERGALRRSSVGSSIAVSRASSASRAGRVERQGRVEEGADARPVARHRFSGLEFARQPGPGQRPMTLDRGRRNARWPRRSPRSRGRRRTAARQSAPGRHRAPPAARARHRAPPGRPAPGRRGRQRFIERDARLAAAALQGVAGARPLDQDLSHRVRRNGAEVRAVLPALGPILEQPQVRLMHECRRLQRLAGALAPQIVRGAGAAARRRPAASAPRARADRRCVARSTRSSNGALASGHQATRSIVSL